MRRSRRADRLPDVRRGGRFAGLLWFALIVFAAGAARRTPPVRWSSAAAVLAFIGFGLRLATDR